MAEVFIPAQLRRLTGGVDRIQVDAGDVRGAVDALERRFPGAGERLCDGGRLSPALAVSIDGAISSRGMFAKIGADSEVHFIPAIGGG